MQSEYSAVSDCLIALDGTIRSDADRAIAGITDTQELDFFFPEILRIHEHDLATINAWREHIDWYQSLPSSDQQELKHLSAASQSEAELEVIQEEDVVLEMPPEYAYYEQVQEYSCAEALKDSLRILVNPNRRTDYEAYISERSQAEGLSTLTAPNLQKATPVTIANLWYYLSIQDEDEAVGNQAALVR
jgi:hypothetical protein